MPLLKFTNSNTSYIHLLHFYSIIWQELLFGMVLHIPEARVARQSRSVWWLFDVINSQLYFIQPFLLISSDFAYSKLFCLQNCFGRQYC